MTGNPTAGGGFWRPRFVRVHDRERCTGCGFCRKVCPAGVFAPTADNEPGIEMRHPEQCWGCTVCARMCKAQALCLDPEEA